MILSKLARMSVICGIGLMSFMANGTTPTVIHAVDDCAVIPCGPSGLFTRDTIPTLSGVDFSVFPRNPARPYQVPGKTLYVRPDGNDESPGTADRPLATVNHAVDLAQTGDLILVADGTYKVGMDQGSGIVLDKPGLILAAEHIGGAILTPADDSVQNGIETRADNLVIDGFVIKGFTQGYGILYGRLDHPERNLVFKNVIIDGGVAGISAVINPDNQVNPQPLAKGMLVNHVLIRNTQLLGLDCGQGPCQDLRIENLVVRMPGGSGENSGADALAMEAGDNILIFNAEMAGASADGIDLKATRVAAINVWVHDIGRNGVKFWQGGDLINALVYNTGADAAVVFESAAAYRVIHTIVARHNYSEPGSAYAMTVTYDHKNDPGTLAIYNSIFFQNSGAIWVSGGVKLDVRNNIFFGSGNQQELVWSLPDGDLTVGEGASPIQELEAAGGGSGNLGFIDPRFKSVAPAKPDFTLLTDSPAIDRGVAGLKDVPGFDMLGNPRVMGAGPDLGPVEGTR